MITVPQIAGAMRRVLGDFADQAARTTGFVQRTSKLTGAMFAQSMVFGWLSKPDASLSALAQTAAAVGVSISNQGLDQRFTPQAAELLKEVLSAAVAEVIAAEPVAIPVLRRFKAVVLQDSSVIVLPNELAGVWKGCGGSSGDGIAALKIQVRLDLNQGTLLHLGLEHGRSQDRNSAVQKEPLPKGALRISDLGYFSLGVLREIDQQGDFYLTRLQVGTGVFDEAGNRLNLVQRLTQAGDVQVDMPVQLGVEQRLQSRLLAVRVPEQVAKERRRRLRAESRRRGQTPTKESLALADWTILVTNAPNSLLSVPDALVLARARWQIELLFKLWKQFGQIDESRSANPWRILCEVYGKLIAMVIQHWLFLVSIWAYPDRSLVKAADTVSRLAMMLATAMHGAISLTTAISEVARCLSAGCRMNRRKTKPNTCHLLLALEEVA